MNDFNDDSTIKEVDLKLTGANCLSCRYAIEHTGRKIEGIENIEYNHAEGSLHVDYSGNDESIEKIRTLINKLGYRSEIIDKESGE